MLDFQWEDHGSLWTLTALTDAAIEWADETFAHCLRGMRPHSIVVEPRYVEQTSSMLADDGWTDSQR